MYIQGWRVNRLPCSIFISILVLSKMSQQQQIEEHSHSHGFQICCALVCHGTKVITCIYIYIYTYIYIYIMSWVCRVCSGWWKISGFTDTQMHDIYIYIIHQNQTSLSLARNSFSFWHSLHRFTIAQAWAIMNVYILYISVCVWYFFTHMTVKFHCIYSCIYIYTDIYTHSRYTCIYVKNHCVYSIIFMYIYIYMYTNIYKNIFQIFIHIAAISGSEAWIVTACPTNNVRAPSDGSGWVVMEKGRIWTCIYIYIALAQQLQPTSAETSYIFLCICIYIYVYVNIYIQLGKLFNIVMMYI